MSHKKYNFRCSIELWLSVLHAFCARYNIKQHQSSVVTVTHIITRRAKKSSVKVTFPHILFIKPHSTTISPLIVINIIISRTRKPGLTEWADSQTAIATSKNSFTSTFLGFLVANAVITTIFSFVFPHWDKMGHLWRRIRNPLDLQRSHNRHSLEALPSECKKMSRNSITME